MTGSVTAEGNTGSTQSITATNASVSPALWPGYCSDVSFTVHNPNGVPSPASAHHQGRLRLRGRCAELPPHAVHGR